MEDFIKLHSPFNRLKQSELDWQMNHISAQLAKDYVQYEKMEGAAATATSSSNGSAGPAAEGGEGEGGGGGGGNNGNGASKSAKEKYAELRDRYCCCCWSKAPRLAVFFFKNKHMPFECLRLSTSACLASCTSQFVASRRVASRHTSRCVALGWAVLHAAMQTLRRVRERRAAAGRGRDTEDGIQPPQPGDR
jgi:hypothetical protein